MKNKPKSVKVPNKKPKVEKRFKEIKRPKKKMVPGSKEDNAAFRDYFGY